MAEFQRQRFASIVPALKAIAAGEAPAIGRHWWEATKGASKDSDLACCLLWLLAFTSRPLAIQIGAADQDQADELRKAAKAILRLNPWLAQRVEVQNWRIACKATASDAEIIAADTAGSHGARPDVLILNELSHVTKWEFAENLMDNASKVPQGLVVIATNAGFIGTPAWKWRELARTSPRWNFNCYDRPSPWLDDAEIEEARRRNATARFNRLWHGVWASGSGDALDPTDIDAAIDPKLAPMFGSIWRVPETNDRDSLLPRLEAVPEFPPEPPQEERGSYSFVAGLDLGIKHDHSALVVLAADHMTQRVRLASAQSWAPDKRTGKVDLEEVESGVVSAYERFGLVTIGYDPYQAELMSQRLSRVNIPMREMPFVGKNLDTMATTLLEVFRSRRIDLFPHDRLVADLRRLSIEEKSYGHRLSATRDIDGHADLATALAIALPAAVELASQRYGPGSVIRLDIDPRELHGSAEGVFFSDRSA
jgi:phage terminase large subunit-like protein